MRVLQAEIDCSKHQFKSPLLDVPIDMHLTKRGLYLVDINDIALAAERKQSGKDHAAKPVGSTFVTLPDDRQTGSNTDGDEPGDMLGKHEMQAGPMEKMHHRRHQPSNHTRPYPTILNH